MDLKTSAKERRLQPDGPVDVLLDNIFDLYPVFDPEDENCIADIEVLDDEREELLDRSMFAVIKQRGLDPTEPEDGCQWEEYLLGEVAAPVVMQQVMAAVSREGPGVRIVPETVQDGEASYTAFTVKLTNAV
jgi:hypothetical protein